MPPRKQVTYSQRPTHAARSAHARGEREFRTYDTSFIRPKRSRGPVVVAIVLAVIVIIGICWGALALFNSCSDSSARMLGAGEQASVVVDEGAAAQSIGKDLQHAGLIASSSDFTKRVNELGVDSQLKPGTYTFAGGTSVDDIIKQLTAGPAAAASLTIPEGSTVAQTAALVAQATNGKVSADAFTAAASNASVYAAEFPFLADVGTNSLEGFLFPKTYPINDDVTADSLVKTMLTQFQKETASLDYSYPTSKKLSAYDVVKLASIVEKESDADHRATVASVFYNRLAVPMRLQSDATTAYQVGHAPTPQDIATDGPYNTYTNDGLPPTPIDSPSLDSLKAVCSPEQTNYLYFYFQPDDKGVMQYYFSETYDEHRSVYE